MSATSVETSIKQEALEMIQRLPHDCTLEDIQYTLYVLEKAKQAQRAIDEGRFHTLEQTRERLSRWLTP